MRRFAYLALGASLAACGGGTSDHTGHADAALPTADAARDAPVTMADAAVHSRIHKLFINTDGVTLEAGPTDAVSNHSDLVSHTTTLLPWMANDVARATKIADMIGEVRTVLAPYDISVVNTRPTAGEYDMFVITDSDATALGFSAGQGGISTLRCGATPKAISFQFAPPYAGNTDAQRMHNFGAYAISTFGMATGIPQSNVYGDCMCYSGQQCGQINAACTIGRAGTVVLQRCSEPTTMDEDAQWYATFGPHF